jgi:hypothetical protein
LEGPLQGAPEQVVTDSPPPPSFSQEEFPTSSGEGGVPPPQAREPTPPTRPKARQPVQGPVWRLKARPGGWNREKSEEKRPAELGEAEEGAVWRDQAVG